MGTRRRGHARGGTSCPGGDVRPRVYYRLTDNWLELTVRFVVRDHGIRDVKDAMSRDILARLDEAGIGIASATFEIVGVPTLKLADGRERHATL